MSTINLFLTCKAPNTTIAEFANTVDPDETAHMSRLIWIYSVCPLFFIQFILKVFRKFADVILLFAFWRFTC